MPSEKLTVSAKELGTWLDVSDRSIREMADKGIVIRVAVGKYDLQASVLGVVRHQRAIAAGRGGATQVLDLAEQRARHAKEQADNLSIKNAQLRGELVSAEEVGREWEDMIRTAGAALLAVPSRCADRLGLERFQTETIDREIREALEALSNETAARDPPEGDGGLETTAEDDAIDMG
ncbi:hypothetical protein [Shinella sp.]|uniref:hypothetical protein n=1 Tax=Shinella sp. TaxID=1870904 RepID=UPI0025829D21|nr:hypothetical protein [Shinella sp.]